MRTLTSAALAALQASPLPLAVLVEMDLSSPLYLNSTSIDMVLQGATYYGTKGLGKVDTISETPAEVKALSFTLSGVPGTQIALALTEPVQGKAVRVKLAVFDSSTYQLLDVRLRWAGLLDVMAIDDGQPTATIQVTAEHAGIDLLRASPTLYSDADQRRLYPGDPSLQYMADQVDMRIVWPAASWGRK